MIAFSPNEGWSIVNIFQLGPRATKSVAEFTCGGIPEFKPLSAAPLGYVSVETQLFHGCQATIARLIELVLTYRRTRVRR